MALPNTPLTFQMPAALVACLSSGKVDVVAAILAAINLLDGTDSNWTAEAATTADSTGNPGVLIKAPATSPIADFRAIIGGAAGAGSTPASGQYLNPDTAVVNDLLLSIGPDGKTETNNWYAADPYGAGKRNSGFWKITPNATITHIGLIASAETLTILLRGGADNQWRACHFGAILDPPDLASAEPVSQRIFGMCVMGNYGNWITSNWMTNPQFLTHQTGANNYHAGIFQPIAPTTTWVPLLNYRFNGTVNSNANCATTFGNNKFLAPVFAAQSNGGGNAYERLLGRFRGIFAYEDGLMRGVLQDGTPADRGYIVSNSTVAAADSFIWANE